MVVLLAVIGALVVGRFVLHTLGSTGRVLKAANMFQATSIEAVNAVRDTPDDEFRQIKAIAAWEQARAFIGSLSAAEQRLAAQTLRDRGFPTAEVSRAICAFIEAKEAENSGLDAEIAQAVRGSPQRCMKAIGIRG
jgi:uncharacterized membrane protein